MTWLQVFIISICFTSITLASSKNNIKGNVNISKDTKTLHVRFSHDFHAKSKKLNCISCHNKGRKIEKKMCHSCHAQKKNDVFVKLDCRSCHTDNRKGLPKPAYHNYLNFDRNHSTYARSNAINCINCHQRNFCKDCHNNARSMKRSPHSPSFLSTHGIEARMGATKCQNCHTKRTCTKCHTK